MAKAVFKAGSTLIRDFGEISLLQDSLKGPQAFAQSTLKRIEKTLREMLDSVYPVYNQDQASEAEESSFFIIQPLEGFSNFQHGLPCFAVTVSFYQENRLTQIVIYDPIKDEMFWSCTETGTYLNQTRLRVSSRQILTDCFASIYFDFTQAERVDQALKLMIQLYQKGLHVHMQNIFSLDVAYTAAGRYDAFWALEPSRWQLDVAHLLITKAGGFIKNTEDFCVAANEKIFNKLYGLTSLSS
jgi:myo-inositol-1(or 4)-monophosphatase